MAARALQPPGEAVLMRVMRWDNHPRAEPIAREFHEVYEELAPDYGYRPRAESSVPWDEVPSANRALMIATVTRLLDRGAIR